MINTTCQIPLFAKRVWWPEYSQCSSSLRWFLQNVLRHFASEILGVHSNLTFQIPQLGILACVKVTDPRKAKTYRSFKALSRKDSKDANQSTQAFQGSRQFSVQLHPALRSQRLDPTGPALAGRVATWCWPRPLTTCCWTGFPCL